jgi:biopolymer transport protein ExbB/TolQ
MSLMVFLDIVVAILLVVAIGAAIVLNRRLAAFRAARNDFEQFIERFDTAAARAEAGVNALRMTSDATGRVLQQTVVRAQALRDEIAFLVERAEPMVDRLSTAHRAAAEAVRPRPAPVAPISVQSPPPAANAAASSGDADLLKTLSSLR